MIKTTLSFVKLSNKWFAHIPDFPGEVEELEMVEGYQISCFFTILIQLRQGITIAVIVIVNLYNDMLEVLPQIDLHEIIIIIGKRIFLGRDNS
jgi:hypothetical protein